MTFSMAGNPVPGNESITNPSILQSLMAQPVPSVHPDYRGVLQSISFDQFRSRARNIRLLLTDNDGVLTDTGVYYSERGEELKRYSIRDGMGVERLRAAGVQTGIITGEVSKNLQRRAEKLGIEHLELGVKDKRARLMELLARTGLTLLDVAYIGDDVNDISLIETVVEHSLVAAPRDAMPKVRSLVHYICEMRGGQGAFREFAEVLLHVRGDA